MAVRAGVREVEVTAVVSVTFAATLPANNKTVASITLDPAYPAVNLLQVPIDESWVIEDVYYGPAAPVEEAIFEFLKNLITLLFRTPPTSAIRVDNVARPKVAPVILNSADILSIVGQNTTVIGAAAVTETAYLKIRRFTTR